MSRAIRRATWRKKREGKVKLSPLAYESGAGDKGEKRDGDQGTGNERFRRRREVLAEVQLLKGGRVSCGGEERELSRKKGSQKRASRRLSRSPKTKAQLRRGREADTRKQPIPFRKKD